MPIFKTKSVIPVIHLLKSENILKGLTIAQLATELMTAIKNNQCLPEIIIILNL